MKNKFGKRKNMKKGVTLLVVILAISIMLILISTASVIGSRSIITANFEEFNLELNRVLDEVNEYYISNGELPIRVENFSIESYQDFYDYLSVYTNDTASKFYIVDMDKLNDLTIEHGRGTTANKDVFLVAKNSHNVYYLAGFKYNKKTYYGLENSK